MYRHCTSICNPPFRLRILHRTILGRSLALQITYGAREAAHLPVCGIAALRRIHCRPAITPHASHLGMKSPELRWPAAIVKIYFPFAALGRDDLTAEKLFPKDEPLYRRLLEVKAPYLAIYA
jgi:hypothetical protein